MDLKLSLKQKVIDTFILSGKINNIEIINNLINFVKNNENKKLHSVTNVKGKFTGFKAGVSNKDFHLFLKLIQPAINVIYKNNFCIFDAWGNILTKGGEVLEHDHVGTTAFCGIIYLSNSGHGTYFSEYDITIEEEIGKFILFHPYLKHSVFKIQSDVERITFAFNCNVLPEWTYDDIKNTNWIN